MKLMQRLLSLRRTFFRKFCRHISAYEPYDYEVNEYCGQKIDDHYNYIVLVIGSYKIPCQYLKVQWSDECYDINSSRAAGIFRSSMTMSTGSERLSQQVWSLVLLWGQCVSSRQGIQRFKLPKLPRLKKKSMGQGRGRFLSKVSISTWWW